MLSREYINFLALLLYNYRAKHLWIVIISSLLIAILASFLFISSSIKRDVELSLSEQNSFILQKFRAGVVQETPLDWVDEFIEINGVTKASGRVYGRHYYEPAESYFTIVGVNFFDPNVVKSLEKLLTDIDIS